MAPSPYKEGLLHPMLTQHLCLHAGKTTFNLSKMEASCARKRRDTCRSLFSMKSVKGWWPVYGKTGEETVSIKSPGVFGCSKKHL